MDIYINLVYEDYKDLERQARDFKETAHGEGTEYYHKAFVLSIGGVRFEFHGPDVKARQIVVSCGAVSPTSAPDDLAVVCNLPSTHSGPHSWA